MMNMWVNRSFLPPRFDVWPLEEPWSFERQEDDEDFFQKLLIFKQHCSKN